MLIADGGGGYGGTDWMSKDVRFMWSAIADQETDPHFDVVGGWRKTADLTLAHLGQVRLYRENLASVWPPSKSPAAAAYIARLDKLIADLQATHDAASANYTAFSTVTLTLSLARHKLKPLLEKYEANQQLMLDWKTEREAAAAKSTTPTLTPTISMPPVSSAAQEELNRQARVIMYDLSNTVLSGQAALQKPKPYTPGGEARQERHEGSDVGSASGFAVPPVIPPPGGSMGGTNGSAVGPVSHTTVTPTQPQTAFPASPITGVIGPGNGPVLGGVGPTPVITPPTTGLPPVPNPTPVPPTPPGLAPAIIGPIGGAGPNTPSGYTPSGGQIPPNAVTKSGKGMGGASRMTMPSGGVIGATPGSGMIGQVPPNAVGGRPGGSPRVNPVGGVIGQTGNGPAGRPTASVAHGMNTFSSPLTNQPGQRRDRGDAAHETTNWDPDNPWATDQGVDPVVLPPESPGPIDPGPAIGYHR